MSAAPEANADTTKAVVDETNTENGEADKKASGAMEGEDEWEDFPQQGKSP